MLGPEIIPADIAKERRRNRTAFLMRRTVMMFWRDHNEQHSGAFFSCHVTKREKQVTIR